MARPLTRPEKPYTIPEIVERVRQHFLVEKNPRCSFQGECKYDLTGCAVGCLFTQEDAEEIEKYFGGYIVSSFYEESPIYPIYFGKDEKILNVLKKLQQTHDLVQDTDQFYEELTIHLPYLTGNS